MCRLHDMTRRDTTRHDRERHDMTRHSTPVAIRHVIIAHDIKKNVYTRNSPIVLKVYISLVAFPCIARDLHVHSSSHMCPYGRHNWQESRRHDLSCCPGLTEPPDQRSYATTMLLYGSFSRQSKPKIYFDFTTQSP